MAGLLDGEVGVRRVRYRDHWIQRRDWLDNRGLPHSDALHLTQTFRRLDAKRMAYAVTVDDPKTYTRPWTNERTFTRLDGPLLEYSCEENNKSLWEGRIKPWFPPNANPPRGQPAFPDTK